MGVSEDGIDIYIYPQMASLIGKMMMNSGILGGHPLVCVFFFSATIETNDREDSSLDTWFGTCPMLISKIL